MKKLFIIIIAVISFLSPISFVKANASIYFTPTSGVVGDTITINSNDDISGADYILFNGVKSIPSINNQYYILTNVPANATTGKITVVGTNINGDIVSSSDFSITKASSTSTNTNSTTNSSSAKSSSGTSSSTSSTYSPEGITFNGLVPVCTSVDSNGSYTNNCDFNMFMVLVNKFINYAIFVLATPLFVIIIIFAGVLLLTAGGNSSNIEKAKKILKNSIIGYIIILVAWLVVKTILTTLGYIDIDMWF